MARFLTAVGRLVVVLGVVICASAFGVTTDVALGELTFAASTFGMEAGLPSNVAQALLQTRDGYMWVGTEAGLARFDGVRFQVFRVSEFPALGDNLIRVLFEDRDGVLWIGTQRGAAQYRSGQFTRVPGVEAPVAAIVQDAAGAVWLGTQGAGLWEVRDGRATQRADGVLMKTTDSPMRLFIDSRQRLWAAINHGPLLCLKQGVIGMPDAPVAGLKQVNRFLEFPRDTLWFATPGELVRFQHGEAKVFGKGAGVGEEPLTDLLVDRSGRLWVAGRSLWVAENPDVDEFIRVPQPQVEYPRYMLQDREGTFWVGSSGDGLVRMRPSAYRLIKSADDVNLQRVRSVSVDRSGGVWAALGGSSHGVVNLTPDGKVMTVLLSGTADGDAMAVCAAEDKVWIGTRGSLAMWDHGTVTRFAAYENVRLLHSSRDHAVWIGMWEGGLARYQDGRFETLAVPPEFKRATPTAVAEAPGGVVYVGFNGPGMLKIDGGKISAVPRLPATEIRAIFLDREERLWVGFRRQGLAVYVDGVWYNPNDFVLPFGERVNAIDEDEGGNLWLGTARGVMWARKQDLMAVAKGANAEGRYRMVGGSEIGAGRGVGSGTQPAMAKAPDGMFWFAGGDGLVAVRPRGIPLNRVAPPVVIEHIRVDGAPVDPGRELLLPAGMRSLEIDYTALSFVQPARVRFRYQLVGHNTDWVQAETRRTAFYTTLAPGRYSFRVAACNEDGIWNEVGAALAIVQQPWFYQTTWFYALVVLGAVGLAAGFYLWRTAALRRLVARQTRQIREQMENESQLRAELERKARLESLGALAGGIAHDFNNLLTVIMANLGLAASDDRVRAAAGDQIAAAERGAQRAAELTQQLLTFAKGGDPIRRPVALADVVREAAEFARHGTIVRCDIAVDAELPPAHVDRAQISRVVHNLVLNAAQAMPNGGLISIHIGAVRLKLGDIAAVAPGEYLKLSISDQGSGIAAEHLPRIFEPYFSTKPKSHGLGLATVHSIVKRHQGHVSVESDPDRGTTFHIWLPAAEGEPAEVPPPRVAEVRRGSRRVLFMDDEEIIRAVAGDILRRLGYEAEVVADGAEAIREYEVARKAGRPFDVVILDLTVPGGMGGLIALEVLKRMDPEVRAIVSSGYSSDPVLANYRNYGFRAVVPKPYRLEELAQAIDRVVAEAAGTAGDGSRAPAPASTRPSN